MGTRRKEGEITRTGPITPSEIAEIADQMEREARRLRDTSLFLNVAGVAKVTMDGITKFAKGLGEIERATDNVILAAKKQFPRTV